MTVWFVGLYQTVLGELSIAVFQRDRCLTFHLLLLQPKYCSATVLWFLHTNTHPHRIKVSRQFYSLSSPQECACSVTAAKPLNMCNCTYTCSRHNILPDVLFVWVPQGFVAILCLILVMKGNLLWSPADTTLKLINIFVKKTHTMRIFSENAPCWNRICISDMHTATLKFLLHKDENIWYAL